jgi:hypothetical protein
MKTVPVDKQAVKATMKTEVFALLGGYAAHVGSIY